MPRINVDDRLFADPRFHQLIEELGDRHKALGVIVSSWFLAQRHWFPDKELIPEAEWNRAKLPAALFDCGLAERRETGTYLKGTEDQCAWLFDSTSRGKKSAEARRLKYGTAQPGRNAVESISKGSRKESETSRTSTLLNSTQISSVHHGDGPSEIDLPRLGVLWNEHRGKLPELINVTPSRTLNAELRWEEQPSDEYWIKVITILAGSSFCNGKNDSGWRADFDFLIQPDTHIKANEGKYGDHSKQPAWTTTFEAL